MAQKLTAPMLEDPVLGGDWQVIFAAVDPTSGAAVAGVKVSGAVLLVETDATAAEVQQPEPLPLFVPIPATEAA